MDTTFCVDLAKGERAAVAPAKDLDTRRERLAIPAPALTEFLIGGFAKEEARLETAIDLVSQMEVIPIDEAIAVEAARIGGQVIRDGTPIGTLDLLIAAAARMRQCPIITRDRDFAAIPGLKFETY